MKWIDINKKKPDLGKRVLVLDDNVVISKLVYDIEYGFTWCDDDDSYQSETSVKYWMELPKVIK